MADIKGEKVKVYETDFVVPRAMLGTAERVEELAASINPESTEKQIRAVLLGQIVEALRRNYPDMTCERFRDEVVPADELLDAHARILVAAKLRKAEGGAEGKAPGP